MGNQTQDKRSCVSKPEATQTPASTPIVTPVQPETPAQENEKKH